MKKIADLEFMVNIFFRLSAKHIAFIGLRDVDPMEKYKINRLFTYLRVILILFTPTELLLIS